MASDVFTAAKLTPRGRSFRMRDKCRRQNRPAIHTRLPVLVLAPSMFGGMPRPNSATLRSVGGRSFSADDARTRARATAAFDV